MNALKLSVLIFSLLPHLPIMAANSKPNCPDLRKTTVIGEDLKTIFEKKYAQSQ